MNISVQKLLGKIEEELRQAKSSDSEARMREKIYAVKTLCELVLEEQSSSANAPQSFSTPAPIQTPVMNPYGQVQKMKIDEESNGDSLFDF